MCGARMEARAIKLRRGREKKAVFHGTPGGGLKKKINRTHAIRDVS